MKKKIILAAFVHESNTFLKNKTPLSKFGIFTGDQILELKGNRTPVAGFLKFAETQDWDIVPTIYLRGRPSGTLEDEVVEKFWEVFKELGGEALRTDADAVFFVLHGAMCSESFEDVEGELLRRIHEEAGREIPVFGVLDPHGNFSDDIAQYSNCLVAYHKNPHTDACETGELAAGLLAKCLESGDMPVTHWRHTRKIIPATATGTDDEPMKSLDIRAREIEARYDNVIAVNIMSGFAYSDTLETGVAFSVNAIDPDNEQLEGIFTELTTLFETKLPDLGNNLSVEEAIEQIRAKDKYPALLVESADNVGGGTPGDYIHVLKALLVSPFNSAGVVINDPEASQIAREHGVGSTVTLDIGGKSGEIGSETVTLEVEVLNLTDGKYTLEDPHSHLASSVGLHIDMGPTALVKHKGIYILLTTNAMPPTDLGQWRSQGVDPENLEVINIKAAVAYRQAYNKISTEHYYIDTIGPTTDNVRSLPYRNVRRPVWPLDEAV